MRTGDALRTAASSTLGPVLRLVLRSQRLPSAVQHRLYWKVARRLQMPPIERVSAVVGGAHVIVEPRGAGKVLYWTGTYEPETLEVFIDRARTARVVLDVGAYDGIYALAAAAANSSATVLAFEPDPTAAEVATRNLASNPHLKVQLHEVALSDRQGELPFFVQDGNSSLDRHFRPGASEIRVEVARGDDFLDRLGHTSGVDLIKIDTESTEPQVLRGLERTIARDRPEIVCEVLAGRTELALNEMIGDFGYETYKLTPHGPQKVDRIVGDPTHRHVNFLFSHRDSRFRTAE